MHGEIVCDPTRDMVDVALLVRTASAEDHRATEGRAFITELLAGHRSLSDYARYLAQYAHVYEALESRDGGPAVFNPLLCRLRRIEADLRALGVIEWRTTHPPLKATAEYTARLHSLISSPEPIDNTARYLAHHYTRYLGDLSGGQVIAALVARHYGATPDQLSFYDFPELGNTVKAKRDYRDQMNALQLDSESVDALLLEVHTAFQENGAILDEVYR